MFIKSIDKKLCTTDKGYKRGMVDVNLNNPLYCIHDQISFVYKRKLGKKYYIITESNNKVYSGASGCSGFAIHKDEQRK